MKNFKADKETKGNDPEIKISGAGAELTALAESLQAYACATRQHLGKPLLDVSQITPKTIADADCDRTLKQCMDGLDEQWFYTVIKTANAIFDTVPNSKTGRNYTFYRGGKFVDSIYDEWRRFKKGSGITGDDKWNPADIWMVKKGYKHKTGFSSLKDYNLHMYNAFANVELIGISLKKLGKNDEAHSKIFNAGKPLTARFTGVKLGQVMTDSKDIYIQYDSEGKSGEVQFRNFSSRPVTSSWQGEIKGKAAAGGKIGGGIIFEGAEFVGVPKHQLIHPPKTPIDKPSDKDFKEFATAFKNLSGSKEKLENLIIHAKAGHRQDKTWWMSKYIGIMLVDRVMKAGKIDDLCAYIFQYASSATENSCIFIKFS
jgi:hypothetical protein